MQESGERGAEQSHRSTTKELIQRTGNFAKAGLPLEASSNAHIASIIESATTTRYAQHQARRSENNKSRVDAMRRKLEGVKDWKAVQREVDVQVERLVSACSKVTDLTVLWVHLDMDAFFASVECRDNPELNNMPMAVGSMSMLSTSNYEARKYGVVSAMPGYIALKLCPQLRIVPHSVGKYSKASRQVAQILEELTGQEDVMLSLDEASFSIPNDEHAEDFVRSIRSKIFEVTHLSCSCGIAHTRSLAKLCSNYGKPNGQFRLPSSNWEKWYAEIPLHKINGIGKVTATILSDLLAVQTVAELWDQRYRMCVAFTPKLAEFLLAVSLGVQGSYYGEDEDASRKSIGTERTFSEHPHLIHDRAKVLAILGELAESLAEDLLAKGLYTTNIGIKWKTVDFDVSTRAETLPAAIQSAPKIREVIERLVDKHAEDEWVRLLGVRASGLTGEPAPQTILDYANKKRTRTSDRMEIKCPVCDTKIASLFEDDPRLEIIVNAHLDKCIKKSGKK